MTRPASGPTCREMSVPDTLSRKMDLWRAGGPFCAIAGRCSLRPAGWRSMPVSTCCRRPIDSSASTAWTPSQLSAALPRCAGRCPRRWRPPAPTANSSNSMPAPAGRGRAGRDEWLTLNKIGIVGGGSAGWICAAMLSHHFKNGLYAGRAGRVARRSARSAWGIHHPAVHPADPHPGDQRAGTSFRKPRPAFKLGIRVRELAGEGRRLLPSVRPDRRTAGGQRVLPVLAAGQAERPSVEPAWTSPRPR